MRELRNLPKLFQRGFYDPDLPKSYVVVHDNHLGSSGIQR